MNIIDSDPALDAVSDPTLRPILERYRDMMDLATIYIVQGHDTLDALAEMRGWPFEDWEFITRHPSGWYEAIFVISQDGAGHVVLLPDNDSTDGDLLSICRQHATNPDDADTP